MNIYSRWFYEFSYKKRSFSTVSLTFSPKNLLSVCVFHHSSQNSSTLWTWKVFFLTKYIILDIFFAFLCWKIRIVRFARFVLTFHTIILWGKWMSEMNKEENENIIKTKVLCENFLFTWIWFCFYVTEKRNIEWFSVERLRNTNIWCVLILFWDCGNFQFFNFKILYDWWLTDG